MFEADDERYSQRIPSEILGASKHGAPSIWLGLYGISESRCSHAYISGWVEAPGCSARRHFWNSESTSMFSSQTLLEQWKHLDVQLAYTVQAYESWFSSHLLSVLVRHS